MFSPLILAAFGLNQVVTDKLNRYRWCFYWSRINQKLCLKTQCFFPHLFLWKFICYEIMLFGFIPCCIIVLYDALRNPEKYSIFQIFLFLIQTALVVTFTCSCWIVSTMGSELVLAFNAVNFLETQISKQIYCKKFENPLAYRNRFFKKLFRNLLSAYSILFDNGLFGFHGCICITVVIWFFTVPPFSTFVAIYYNLDVPYFVLVKLFPFLTKSVLCFKFVMILRTVGFYLVVTEITTACRTIGIIAIASSKALKSCVFRLSVQAPDFKMWHALRIFFQIANIPVAYLLSLYLGPVFLMEILCISGAVLAIGKMPWFMYMIFPFIGIIAAVEIFVIFYELVYGHAGSIVLQKNWLVWYATVGNRSNSRFQLKVGRRILESMQPLAFNYSSMGHITKATRTDFYYSILSYSITLILLCRDRK